MGNFFKFERCTVFSFRVDGDHGQTDGQTDRQIDEQMDGVQLQRVMRLPKRGPHYNQGVY